MERLPGFRDFYPEPLPHSDVWSCDVRHHIFQCWREASRRYGFREYDGPPLESLELFTTKSGDEIVGQLYNFTDKGEREIALRPEMTPTLARMVAAHERNYKKPIKWFSIPQLFRYERQQKGRMREHFQFNADIIGEKNPSADAELMALAIDALRNLGLSENDFILRLSSRNAWLDFFLRNGGKAQMEYAFYQAVDKLERETPEKNDEKLRQVGFTLQQVTDFIETGNPTSELASILEDLNSRGLGGFVRVDYRVIRGLAYYTGPVFEIYAKQGKTRAIAGGGRYDHLLKLISNQKVDLPALGFGMGDVVLADLLRERGLIPRIKFGPDVFFALEDETLRPRLLLLVQRAREGGISTDYPLVAARIEKQIKRAQELEVRLTAILQRDASGTPVVRVRDEKGEQRLPFDESVDFLRKTLGNGR